MSIIRKEEVMNKNLACGKIKSSALKGLMIVYLTLKSQNLTENTM